MTGYGVRPCPVFVGAILGRSGGNCGLRGGGALERYCLFAGVQGCLCRNDCPYVGRCCALLRRGMVCRRCAVWGKKREKYGGRGTETGRKLGTAYAAGAGKTLRPEGVWMFPAVVVWVRRRYCRQALRLDGVSCRCRRAGASRTSGGLGTCRSSWQGCGGGVFGVQSI